MTEILRGFPDRPGRLSKADQLPVGHRPMKPLKAWNRLIATPAELRALKAQGMTDRELARHFDVSPSTVIRRRKEWGIPANREGLIKRLDPEWLRQAKETRRSDADIAREFGVQASTLNRIRRQLGITDVARVEISPEWLAEKKQAGLPDAAIAAELGCHVSTVQRAREKMGLRVYRKEQMARPRKRAGRDPGSGAGSGRKTTSFDY